MGCDDVLLSAKGFKSTVLGRFWHSRGNSKACNCHRFLRLDSASSGPKAIVHFTLMRLRQHKITTCSVYTATVLALHRLAAPRAPETNLKFQISDQRWSLCIPCICDCCSIGVKITTCMDMHGSALVYPYILGGGFRLPGASGPLGHWPASANGASKSARKMTCKRLPKCVRNGSRNEPKRLPATLLVASRITFQNRPLLRGSKM